MTISRPVLRYHGGKWRIAPWIISHFPPHNIYIEPFGGAASVLLRKRVCRTEIYNDLDSEIASLFRVIRDQKLCDHLADQIDRTPFSRDEFNEAYSTSPCPVERARRTLIKSFMGMGSKGIWIKSGFDARVNDDGFVSRKNAFVDLPTVLRAACSRLREVILENCDGVELCRRYYCHPETLIYVDPPYVFDSYKGAHVYRCRMTNEEHAKLASVLNSATCAVIVSGYESDLYAELFASWRRVERPALADGAAKRTEVLWLRNCPDDSLFPH